MSSRRSRLGQAESSSGRDGTGSQRSDKWLAILPGLLLASGLAGVAWVACTRRRHPSSASPARRTTWKGSITATASGSS